MACDVEAFAFLFDGDTQADDEIDELEEDCRTDARPEKREDHGLALDPELAAEGVGTFDDGARRGDVISDACSAETLVDKDAGGKRAENSANAVDAEDIERVVITEGVLDRRAEEEADGTGGEAEDDLPHRTGISARRRDGDKACNRTRHKAE